MVDVSWMELLVVIVLGWLLTDPKDYIHIIRGIRKAINKINMIRNEVNTIFMEISNDSLEELDNNQSFDQESLKAKKKYMEKLSMMYFEAKYNKEDDNTTIH